jgi:hypothetical protein
VAGWARGLSPGAGTRATPSVFSRRQPTNHHQAKAAAIAAGTLPYTASDDDDDLRAAEGKPRLDGSRRTPHAALTATQASVVARLVAAHGEDVGAMARDTKLNRMLLPPSKLRVLLEAWKAAGAASEGGGVRCRFAQPVKSLKGRRPF